MLKEDMKMSDKVEKASVLAFEKKIVPSDGSMYGAVWNQRHTTEDPIRVVEKSVRGTISDRREGANAQKPDKLKADIKVPNLQTVDHAALAPDQDTLVLRFSLKILKGIDEPSACDSPSEYGRIQNMVRQFTKEDGFEELARRYALNIANGRFLWRNRVGAEQLEITVKAKDREFVFNGYDFDLKSFDTQNADVLKLAKLIEDVLCGDEPYLYLEIEACALEGKGQDVYPSEEMVLDNKGKGDKKKILYKIGDKDMAGMHSQKLGNALRTIDTWYPDAAENHGQPIAIEPYGVVTHKGIPYRPPKHKDFYSLFDAWVDGKVPEDPDDRNYVMAVLIRGGVFGSSKAKGKAK